MLNARVVDSSGSKGNFTTGVKAGSNGDYQKIQHGVAILATGAYEWKPNEFLYGEDPRIVTQLELEGRIVHTPSDITKAKKGVMIQCVGSGTKNGRIAAGPAVPRRQNALKIKS
jgi:heterodisulfide reductase subunit A